MIALLAAALLVPGATELSVVAGSLYTAHLARGVGGAELQLELDYIRRGAVRPSAGARLLLIQAGPAQLSVRALAGRVLPTRSPTLIAPTWDLQAGARLDVTLPPFCLSAESGALLETTFRAEHTAVYGVHLLGLEAAIAGPLWLKVRGGLVQAVDHVSQVAWAGAALRW